MYKIRFVGVNDGSETAGVVLINLYTRFLGDTLLRNK